MSRSTQRRRQLASIFAVSLGATLWPASAHATAPSFVKLQYGVGGPQEAEGGAGSEQPDVSVIYKNGRTYVVTIWMSSFVEPNDRNWQCKCSSIELGSKGPGIVVDQRYLTHGGGDRPCNHPRAASDGKNIVWAFGSDMNDQTNVSTYAGVINEKCEHVVDPVRVSENANNNEAAPDISFNGTSGGIGYFTAGYLSQGTNDISYALGLRLHDDGTSVSLEKTYLTNVVTPANIGRPAIVAGTLDRSLFCAAKGDNRPPEDGVECAWLDAMNGTILWKDIIAASQPGNNIFMNQPSVAKLDFGRYAINVQESNGAGNKTDTKGSNESILYIIEPTDSTYSTKAQQRKLGNYQTHASICAGPYGTVGERAVGIISASITGAGQPELLMAKYSTTGGIQSNSDKDTWIITDYGDSGYLANIYGQNPHTQGRDFHRCIGDVRNPGHGVKNGFMPEVETLFVAPMAGRTPGEPKNSLWVSFVPGKTDIPVTPEPPEEGSTGSGVGPGSTTATTSSTTSTGSGAGGSGGSGGGGNNEDPGGFRSDEGGGCACTVPGESAAKNGLGALAMLALGMLVVTRRRREEG